MPAPTHPLMVHLPLALALLLPFVSGLYFLAHRRGWVRPNAWWVVVALQALLVGTTVLALRTGEAEEERVEQIVPERAIEAHEEAAERFLFGTGLALALAAAGGVFAARRREWLGSAAIGTAVAGLAVAVLAVNVGKAGGELVYTHGAASAYVLGGSGDPGRRGRVARRGGRRRLSGRHGTASGRCGDYRFTGHLPSASRALRSSGFSSMNAESDSSVISTTSSSRPTWLWQARRE